MPFYYSKSNKRFSQELRKNMTRQERRIWYDFLRGYALQFRRQKQFGRYIADFYCSAASLVIEIDGGQHFTEEQREYDEIRTCYLESLGLRVLRFSNDEVDKSFDAVCEKIDRIVMERSRCHQREEYLFSEMTDAPQ